MPNTEMHNPKERQTWHPEDYDSLAYRNFHQEARRSEDRHSRGTNHQKSEGYLYIDFYALEDHRDHDVHDAHCNTTMHYRARGTEIREDVKYEVVLAKLSAWSF